MVLSLIIAPAVRFYLSYKDGSQLAESDPASVWHFAERLAGPRIINYLLADMR